MEKGTAMTNQEIYDLIACFERSSLQTLRLSRQDFSIELSRGGARCPCGPRRHARSCGSTCPPGGRW